jgi:hypothetical protein
MAKEASSRSSPSEIEIRPFVNGQRDVWEDFVHTAKNGHFMLTRAYMDHHGDRFADRSLMFYRRGALIGVMPAHSHEGWLYSHRGLPFAGLICIPRMRAAWVLELFRHLRAWLIEESFVGLLYRAVPWPYHDYPAEEDLYALQSLGASTTEMNVTHVLRPSHFIDLHKNARYVRSKGHRAGIEVRPTEATDAFFDIHEQMHRERHGSTPLHSREELAMLMARFPENIRLLGAFEGNELIGGLIVFVDRTVVRIQKLGQTERGRDLGAFSLLVEYLTHDAEHRDRWIDFGTSTDPATGQLQPSLAAFKEYTGGSAIVTRTLSLKIGSAAEQT